MKPCAGQIWIRRIFLTDYEDHGDRLHVTLAYLGDDRYLSISLGGELNLWPNDGIGPDFKQWELLEGT